MLDGSDAQGLVEPLISGLVEDPLWSRFLERLRTRTGADYASIVFRPLAHGPQRNRVIHLYAGEPSPPGVSRLYHDFLHASDPLPYQDMVDGRVYALDELLRFGDPEHESYFDLFLAPSGMTILRMVRVVEPGGVSAWLTISRRAGEFAPDIDGLLAGLAPFFRAALTSHVALEREVRELRQATEILRKSSAYFAAAELARL